MKEYISTSSLLSEARMMCAIQEVTYIFVEGDGDVKFYKENMGLSNAYYRDANGWENVVELAGSAAELGLKQIWGIIDRDYHDFANEDYSTVKNLLLTDENDVEMMMFMSPAFEKFLFRCSTEDKTSKYSDLREPILNAAARIGVFRMISYREKLGLVFGGIKIGKIVDRNTLDVDVERLLNQVYAHTRENEIEIEIKPNELKALATEEIDKYSKQLLCRGHDVMDILSIAMQRVYGSNDAQTYSAEIVSSHLFMGYIPDYLHYTTMYRKLNENKSA